MLQLHIAIATAAAAATTTTTTKRTTKYDMIHHDFSCKNAVALTQFRTKLTVTESVLSFCACSCTCAESKEGKADAEYF
jgi:hypothetical protein